MPRLSAAFSAAFLLALSFTPVSRAEPLPEVCATVDGEPISRFDLLRAADTVALSANRVPSELSDTERLDLYRDVLREMISDRLIGRAAKGVNVSDDEVNARFKELQAGYPNPETFKEEMIKAGQTESLIRENIRLSIQQERWLASQVADKLAVTPEEVEKAYKENQATFTEPEAVRVSHILVEIPVDATPEVIVERKSRIDGLASRLVKEKGANFAALAKETSDDASTRERGGDIGYFVKGQTDSAFEKAAFQLKVGDISAPVRTKVGFHLIQQTGTRPPRVLPLEEVRDRIATIVRGEKRKEALQKLLASLREKAKIEIKLPN